MVRIARVFPRRTKATPADDDVFVGEPPLFAGDYDKVMVSVTFTWDIPEAERIANSWKFHGPVEIGGPAIGTRGEEFVPGMFLRHGYIITSRGCPNRCWFCQVWRRDGNVRVLAIRDGWNVLDDNLLACPSKHILDVALMLRRQTQRPEFTGGLEAKRLTEWHCRLLADLRPRRVYFAYDTPDDREPLRRAGEMLRDTGFTTASHVLSAYVLIGYPGDDFAAAEQRLRETGGFGFMPYAMLYRNAHGQVDKRWKRFQRQWLRPQIVSANLARTLMRRAGGDADR